MAISNLAKKSRDSFLGMFITFEGIEGSGKTTHLGLAAKRLTGDGYTVFQTREPGGTSIGEQVRSVLLSPENRNMSPLAELMLYEACRAQLIAEHVRPELEKGSLVLCDRYLDATTAYQGYGRGLDLELVERLNQTAGQGVEPDLTILLDCPVGQGLERIQRRYRHHLKAGAHGVPDRMEAEDLDFHERIRLGYLRLAERHCQRILRVDATADVEEVHAKVMDCLYRVLREPKGNVF